MSGFSEFVVIFTLYLIIESSHDPAPLWRVVSYNMNAVKFEWRECLTAHCNKGSGIEMETMLKKPLGDENNVVLWGFWMHLYSCIHASSISIVYLFYYGFQCNAIPFGECIFYILRFVINH